MKLTLSFLCSFTDQLKKLQRRYETTEDELHKKRAELREALRNDASPQLRPPRSSSRSSQGHPQQPPPASSSEDGHTIGHYKFKKYGHSLPKMDIKSPARIIEEKSCENSSRSSRSATPPISADRSIIVGSTPNDMNETSNTNDSMPIKSVHLRRRSGTPASIRSRVSILLLP